MASHFLADRKREAIGLPSFTVCHCRYSAAAILARRASFGAPMR